MICLDGKYLEGGGQIVRTALALSVLTGLPFTVRDIRGGRKVAGLKAQHVQAVKALQEWCAAKVAGAFVGSSELIFIPGKLKPKNIEIDMGTAGSITLLLQALLPVMVFGPKRVKVTVTGGTDVPWSCPADYFAHVVLPCFEQYAKISFKINKRGYYPKGGGSCVLSVTPFFHFPELSAAPRLDLREQGVLLRCGGVCQASSSLMAQQVVERISQSASSFLKTKYNLPVSVRMEYASSLSSGCGVTLFGVCSTRPDDVLPVNRRILGADALGEPGVESERVGVEVAKRLVVVIESGAAVDKYMADVIVPFMGLLPGSVVRAEELTLHTRTNMYVVESFLGVKFEIKGQVLRT